MFNHLGRQVINNITVVAGKGLNEPGSVTVIPKRQRSKLQPGDPTLSAYPKCYQVIRGSASPII